MKKPRISFNLCEKRIAITANDFIMTGSWPAYKEFTREKLQTLANMKVSPKELAGFDVVTTSDHVDVHLPTLYLEIIPMAIKMASQLDWDEAEKVKVRAYKAARIATLKAYGILPPFDKNRLADQVFSLVTKSLEKRLGWQSRRIPDSIVVRVDPELVEALKFVLTADKDALAEATGLPAMFFLSRDDLFKGKEDSKEILRFPGDPIDIAVDTSKLTAVSVGSDNAANIIMALTKKIAPMDVQLIKRLADILKIEPAEITPPFDRDKVAEKLGKMMMDDFKHMQDHANPIFVEAISINPTVLEALGLVCGTTDTKELSALLKVQEEYLSSVKVESSKSDAELAAEGFELLLKEFLGIPDETTSEREELKKDCDEFREIAKAIESGRIRHGRRCWSYEKDDNLTLEEKFNKLSKIGEDMKLIFDELHKLKHQ